MSIPVCPVHGKPMREGKFGYFCAQKVGDEWCKEKAKAAPKPTASVTQEPVHDLQTLPKVRLAEAALQFAGRVYQGSGPVGANEALVLAAQAYKWLVDGEALDVPNF